MVKTQIADGIGAGVHKHLAIGTTGGFERPKQVQVKQTAPGR